MGRKISLSLKRSAIKANWFRKATNGTEEYMDFDVYENDQPDKYGNHWSVKQTPPKAIRADMKQRGEKIPYCGNGKEWDRAKSAEAPAQGGKPPGPTIDEDVPFAPIWI